jgi:hypothetical protein
MFRNVVKNTIKIAAIALLAWLPGCGLTSPSTNGHLYEAKRGLGNGSFADDLTPLTPELNDFFELAPPGAVARAALSPWGEEVEIAVAALYDAASGRRCRELAITDPVHGARPGLVCRVEPKQWEPVRPIAVSGK